MTQSLQEYERYPHAPVPTEQRWEIFGQGESKQEERREIAALPETLCVQDVWFAMHVFRVAEEAGLPVPMRQIRATYGPRITEHDPARSTGFLGQGIAEQARRMARALAVRQEYGDDTVRQLLGVSDIEAEWDGLARRLGIDIARDEEATDDNITALINDNKEVLSSTRVFALKHATQVREVSGHRVLESMINPQDRRNIDRMLSINCGLRTLQYPVRLIAESRNNFYRLHFEEGQTAAVWDVLSAPLRIAFEEQFQTVDRVRVAKGRMQALAPPTKKELVASDMSNLDRMLNELDKRLESVIWSISDLHDINKQGPGLYDGVYTLADSINLLCNSLVEQYEQHNREWAVLLVAEQAKALAGNVGVERA